MNELTFPLNSLDTTFREKSVNIGPNKRRTNAKQKRYSRVSPFPPPWSRIAEWCLCCHESLVMVNDAGFSAVVSYDSVNLLESVVRRAENS